MRFIVMVAFVLLVSPVICSAQEWRGIKPLRSTCEDVKRALGVDKCEYPESTYQWQDETVSVGFVMCPCPLICYHASSGWNVPPGTVGGITRRLRKPKPVAEFNVSSVKWKKIYTDFVDQVIYDNYEEGVTLSAINGEVFTVNYYAPLDKNQDLLCPKCSVPKPPNADREGSLSSWFKGYGDLGFDEEKKRLDIFADKLQEHGKNLIGYIVAYGGCRARKGEAKARAERAKEYVVNAHGINRLRIRTIDGGQREGTLIELHIPERNQPPPLIFSSTYPPVACDGSASPKP